MSATVFSTPWNPLSWQPASGRAAAARLLQLRAYIRACEYRRFSEFVATFGLLVVVHGTGKRAAVVPLTVAAYVTAAYWFTSSTSFANPAVTIARGLTDTFSGIEPAGVPGFIAAQFLGALAATVLFRWIGAASQ
jgi:glycerol uptake facilitator-like aquaporin